MSRSGILWVLLFLGICMGMVTATARDPEREIMDLSGRRWQPIFPPSLIKWLERNTIPSQPQPTLSTLSRHHHRHHPRHPPWWRHHRHHPNHPIQPPPPPPPLHEAPPPSSPPQPPRVAPSPPPQHATPPPPPPVDKEAPPPPQHAAQSPSPLPPPPADNVAPILPPPPPMFRPPVVSPSPPASSGDEPSDCSMVLIKVDGCISDLITSFFKDQVSLSTNCCKVVSRISNDCFDRAFTHFSEPIFLTSVRNYCSHQR